MESKKTAKINDSPFVDLSDPLMRSFNLIKRQFLTKGAERFAIEYKTHLETSRVRLYGHDFPMNLVTKALSTDSVEVLKELSEHKDPSVRMAVASNHLHDPLWWVNDVDMMYFYWQDQRLRFEGQRLPEELHNSMIALATNGDETANKYVQQSETDSSQT